MVFAVLGSVLAVVGHWNIFTAYRSGGVTVDEIVLDAPAFARIGNHYWSGDFAFIYADRYNQTGPAQTLLDSLLLHGVHAVPQPWGWVALAVIICASVLLSAGIATVWLARKSHLGHYGWLLATLPVLLLIAMDAPYEVFTSGHWWQIAVLWCWFGAGWGVVRRHPILAGVLLAVSATLEPWAVFGLVAVLFSATLRNAITTGAVAVAGILITWAPFALLWPFRIGEYNWSVGEHGLWTAMLAPNSPFPWAYRLLQAAIVSLLSAGVVFLVRPQALTDPAFAALATLTLPALIVLFRVGTDILFYSYYLITPQVFLLPIMSVAVFRWRWRGALFAVPAYLVLLGTSGIPPYGLALAASLIASVALIVIAWGPQPSNDDASSLLAPAESRGRP